MGVSGGSVRSRLNVSPGCSAAPRAISVLFVPTPPGPPEPRATLLPTAPPSRSPGRRRQKVWRRRWAPQHSRATPKPGWRWEVGEAGPQPPGARPRTAKRTTAGSQSRGGSASARMERSDVMHPCDHPGSPPTFPALSRLHPQESACVLYGKVSSLFFTSS